MNITNFFNDNFWLVVTLISTLTLPITTIINSKFKLNKVWKQVTAWATSVILTALSYFCNIVTFSDPAWLSVILTGVICGLSSNGIYDVPTIKKFINKYFAIFNEVSSKNNIS